MASIATQASASEAFLAQPPGACCLKGSLHEGEARGTTKEILGVDTYIAQPEPSKANGHAVLYFPDVWGLYKNSFLIMDGYADAGYQVLGIDYFRGDPVQKHRLSKTDTTTDPGFDFNAWKTKHKAFADEIVPKWVSEVKTLYGKPGKKFAVVGYCFGAPYACELLAGDVFTVGAFAHPASLTESHFANLTKPLLLSCAEIDQAFNTESRNRAVDILHKEKKDYQVQLFSGVEHGFGVRGDNSNPYERYVKEQSLSGIVAWFDFWLGQ